MKISVAMATYNGAKYLQAQLDSLLAQTYKPDELVVCDDGSSDGTIEALTRFQNIAPFPVRTYRNDSNLGYVQNFARAISYCEGELIFLSDQDDVWRADKIQKMADTFLSNPEAGYVFSDAELVDENLLHLGTLWKKIGFVGERHQRYMAGDQVGVMLGGGNFVYGNCLAFRGNLRESILPIRNTSVTLAHDTWISLLLSVLSHYGVALSEPLVAYRQHPHQVVGAGKKPTLEEGMQLIKQSRAQYCQEKIIGLRAIGARAKNASVEALQLIEQCIIHLQARSSLHSQSKLNKLRTVWQETVSGRYTRFSSSLKSALKDLIFT